VMKGELFTVISGCVPALIGDDVDAVVQEFKDKATVIHVNAPGFSGTSYNGYEAYLDAVIDQLLTTKLPVENKLVNILGIVPNQHVFWKGDLEIVKRLLEKIGVKVNTIFLDFDGVNSLKKIPAAELNLVFSPWLGIKAAQKLKDEFGTPFEIISHIPVGPKDSSALLQRVGKLLDISENVVNQVIEEEERKAYRYTEYLSEAFMISVPHAYFGVVADSRTAIELVRYGSNELGWNPEIVIVTDNPPDEFREAIIKGLTQNLDGVVTPQIIFEIDSHKILQELKKHTLQVLLASSLEKYVAQDELEAIHLSIAYPVFDKVIVDKSYAGYRGGIALFEDLTATFAGPL
jgi:nitrogenase molybdenum-iron protein beta chain